jgi:D-xylose 1-dehydrogenase (NADP+, D-xylono-1,5-lactone-forming)
MEKVRFGFIGAGLIAKLGLYPAMLDSSCVTISAVASRDRERARALSPSGKVYTDYQELLDDPEIEAVYISLPNSLHIPWSIKAMQAGKHVLCEKPIAMNAQELKEAIKISESTGKLLMEASWNRWHPRTVRIKQLVDSGVIGKITAIDTSATYSQLNDINKIRTTPELGGGSLYDLGPYSAVAPLWITDFAPVKDIKTKVHWHSDGCDETLIINYKINDIECRTLTSMNIKQTDYLTITGTEGKICTPGNDAYFSYNSVSNLIIENNYGKIVVEEFEACDPYKIMAEQFANYVRGEKSWVMSIYESLNFSQFFDSIRKEIYENRI